MTGARTDETGFDLYWSFRSPYSYLAVPQLAALVERYALAIRVRPVLPLAVRKPGFFKEANPLWLPYLMRDVMREGQRKGIPIAPPQPDPVVMDMSTGDVPADQPYIHRLTRLGQLTAEAGAGFAFIQQVAPLIWSGAVKGWDQGDHLDRATAAAGLSLDALDRRAIDDAERLDGAIAGNQQALEKAGHWGVPTMVFRGEPFFGQDRIDALVWRLGQAGAIDPAQPSF